MRFFNACGWFGALGFFVLVPLNVATGNAPGWGTVFHAFVTASFLTQKLVQHALKEPGLP